MADFCGKCGHQLDKKTGKCPVCSLSSTNGKNNKKTLIVVICIIVGVLLIAGGVIATVCFLLPKLNDDNEQDVFQNATIETQIETTSSIASEPNNTVPAGYINADEYFEQNADVVSKIKANESKNVSTEKDAYDYFTDRGFSQIVITTMYDMEGTYLAETEIAENSDNKHPMYTTYYAAANGELWAINYVNGSITALPVMYNQEYATETEILITEEETIMTYDGVFNKFYEIKPHTTIATLKQVARIDATTLDNLTAEEIDKL